jgi:two-component system response regulator VicR
LPKSLEVFCHGQMIRLTPTEFEILYCLVQHANEAVSLATLLQEVWGYDASDDVRTVRVHVGGLRQKVELDAKHPTLIQTVNNVGYRLNIEESQD